MIVLLVQSHRSTVENEHSFFGGMPVSRDIRQMLSAHPQWKIFPVVCVFLPAVAALAIWAFAWPASSIAPRDLPVGLVGSSVSTELAVQSLQQGTAGDFDLRIYADEAIAKDAIHDREVYGALEISPADVRVLISSAASPAVARLLTSTADELAASAGQPHTGAPKGVTAIDVVPAGDDDPQGLVLSAALLPLSICSIIIAGVITLLVEFRPAWRMIASLVAVSAAAGLSSYLVAQPGLDALPTHGFAAWAALSLMILAMSSTAAGLVSLAGAGGLGVAAAMMVFIGNPFSGSTSAPELLPSFAHHVGQALPPGAGANLLRSIVYFDGEGAEPHLWVLIAWTAVGFAMIHSGHRSFIGFAARRQAARDHAVADELRLSSTPPAGYRSTEDAAVVVSGHRVGPRRES